jgi:hypothetical protein
LVKFHVTAAAFNDFRAGYKQAQSLKSSFAEDVLEPWPKHRQQKQNT